MLEATREGTAWKIGARRAYITTGMVETPKWC